MTDRVLLKNAFIADLCGHPSAATYRRQLISSGITNDVDGLLAKVAKSVTKADILTKNDMGEYFLNCPQSWQNFSRIAEFVNDKGEPFVLDDFLTVVQSTTPVKNILDCAVDHKGLESLFAAEIWRGRYQEAEKVFYNIPVGRRKNYDGKVSLSEIKRSIYALDNKKTREDVLAELNIESQDFPKMFMHGGVERIRSLSEKLERHGLSLTKEDLFFADEMGDTMFFYPKVWTAFDEIVEILAKNGERFEVQDFLKQNGTRPSVIKRAQEAGAMDKIFNPVIWDGRLDEMLELWSKLKPLEKEDLGRDRFADLVARAEDKMYGGLLPLDNTLQTGDLTKPIAIEGKVKVYPLGLESTWQNWHKIQAAFTVEKKKFPVEALRQKSGYLDRTVLEMAVKNGQLENIVDMMIDTKQGFQVEDLMQRDYNANSLLMTIARRKELATLFTPKLWAGHVNDMKTLWAQLPVEFKSQVNWSKTLSETNVETLHSSNHGKKPPLKRRR